MANENVSDLINIIDRINKNEILLPDFQRAFVWRDEERQKKLIASVLCKMPVGSILLLHADPNDYAAKVIGCKNKMVNTSNISDKVDFLLDGQQRITVLSNVFSNVIHENCPKVSELVASIALKRRFFLKLPRWNNPPDENEDWFGIRKLLFPMEQVNHKPNFLTSQVYSYIHVENFNANDGKPYNPAQKLSTKLDDFCISYSDGYLIPLFLMCPFGIKADLMRLRFSNILERTSNGIKDEILNHYMSLIDKQEKCDFVKKIFPDVADEILDDNDDEQGENFKMHIEGRGRVWRDKMTEYLKSCITGLELNQIGVDASQRARAIDIYENLNMGGVCLNTFDLIMARVAKVNKENFHDRMIRLMCAPKKYSVDVLPGNIKKIIRNRIKNNTYNATIQTQCFVEMKNELNSRYIDIFLNVLGILCSSPTLDTNQIKLDNIKKDYILSLNPEKIDNNCEKVIEAVDRAMFFLQCRCGIRSIQEVNYYLMVVLLAVIFAKDENFANHDVHDLLEGWYWSVLFSGEYDKDQNTRMINNLKSMLETINKQKDMGWLNSIRNNVFALTNFSEKSLLLMEKVNEDRLPKKVLRNFICQYMLSKTYTDMFDVNKCISVFSDEADTLEAHHIIPLGTVKKVGENTAKLRDKPEHICNSPVNFVYITQKANKEISDKPLSVYVTKIRDEAKSVLHLTSYKSSDVADTDKKIHDLLETRFNALCGDVKNHINECFAVW